jgi:hypothetical protein
MADVKQIRVAFPPVESKTDPAMAQQLHSVHQLISDRLSNHFTAIQNLNTQIAELQKQVQALQGKK